MPKLAASFGMDCVGEAGPAPRETARGGTARSEVLGSLASGNLLSALRHREDAINAVARSRGYVLTACGANAAKTDRHADDLAPIIARLDPAGFLSPSRPYPFSIESLTLRPRRSKCTPHRGHAAIRQ